MRRRLKQIFETPRMWVTAGAILIASSLAIGYHQDQRLAHATLAAMDENPAAIALQDISRNRNSIIPTGTQLLAEVDLINAARRSIVFGDTQESYVLVPAYAVSETARDRVNMFLRKNAGEGLSGQSQVGLRSKTGHPVPVGILVFDVSTYELPIRRFESMGLQHLGSGLNGEIVLFTGATFNRTKWQDALAATLFDGAIIDVFGEGANTLPLIAPSRPTGAMSPDLSRMRGTILMFGFAFLLCGGLVVQKRFFPSFQRRVRRASGRPEENPSVNTSQSFEPIASQDELHNEDEFDRSSEIVSKVLSRTAEAIGRSTKPRVRSRL